MRLPSFRIERWYERYEFTTELQLSKSDCESGAVGELLALEPDARERLGSLRLGYTEVPGSPELREAISTLYERTPAATGVWHRPTGSAQPSPSSSSSRPKRIPSTHSPSRQ